MVIDIRMLRLVGISRFWQLIRGILIEILSTPLGLDQVCIVVSNHLVDKSAVEVDGLIRGRMSQHVENGRLFRIVECLLWDMPNMGSAMNGLDERVRSHALAFRSRNVCTATCNVAPINCPSEST